MNLFEMKGANGMKYFTAVLFLLSIISSTASAQWPGHFYTFELKDANGNFVDSLSKDYKMTTAAADGSGEVMLFIDICEDNRTWRYYEGVMDFDKVHKLIIEKSNDNKPEVMVIEFPSSLTGGKDQYYANINAGAITFKPGIYRIKLPETPEGWDELKEIEKCPDPYNKNQYLDVRSLQKQN